MAKEEFASKFQAKRNRRPWDESADGEDSGTNWKSIGDLAVNAVLEVCYQLSDSHSEENSQNQETVDKAVDTRGKES